MRFDFTEIRRALPDKLVPSLSTTVAAGGISLATLMVGYVVLFGGNQSVADTDQRTTTVAVAGPVFTPVVSTPAVSEPAEKTVDAPAPKRERAARPSQPQSERDVARAIQVALKDAGCYRGKVTGRWTPMTSAAMDEFTMRVNARLPVDKPDPVLLALLETHDEVSCRSGSAPSARPSRNKLETAGTHDEPPAADRPTMQREAELAPTRAEHLSFAGSGWQRREFESARPTNASVKPDETAERAVRKQKKVSRERRYRKSRKSRRKPSLSRDVRRSFRSIQRSMRRLF